MCVAHHTLCTTQLTDASDHLNPGANALGNDQNQNKTIIYVCMTGLDLLLSKYLAMVLYLITHASLSITACHNMLSITSLHMYTICTRRIHHPHTVLHTTGAKTAASCQRSLEL